MRITFNAFLQRLFSRKLWLAIGAFITLIASEQYTEAVAVVIAYIGAEGAADVADRVTGSPVLPVPSDPTSFQPIIDNDDVDTSIVEAGTPMFDEKLKDR